MPNGSIRAPTYRSNQGLDAAPGDATSLHSSSAVSTRPPSYGRHLHDELLSPPGIIPNVVPVIRGNARSSRPRSTASIASTTCHITQMLQTLTSTDPLTLTIDNNLLYPPPPSSALYHLPRVLTWSGTEISLARSLPWPSARRGVRYPSVRQARDLALYTMRRVPFTHEVALVPRREGLKAAVMKGHRSLLGNMTWEVEVRGSEKPLLTYSKGRWKDSVSGRIIARERLQQVSPPQHQLYDGFNMGKNTIEQVNVITIEGQEVELWLKDLVVASWCSRVWLGQSHRTKALFGRSLIAGIGR